MYCWMTVYTSPLSNVTQIQAAALVTVDKNEIQRGKEKMAKKSIAKSIRLSREVFEYIDKYRGNGFNEKFENIILDYQQKENAINDRIKAKQEELKIYSGQVDVIMKKIRRLENIKWSVDNCLGYCKRIEDDLKELAGGVLQK